MPTLWFAVLFAAAIVVIAVLATMLVTRGDDDAPPAAYDDPFAYCAAAGTIDAADGRYTGVEYPQSVNDRLAAAMDMPRIPTQAPWRCVDGDVWACFVGANLPCGLMDTNRVPTAAMNEACRTRGMLAAVDTGHATVYAWSCENGVAVAGEQIVEVDARGFGVPFWYRLSH